MNLWIHAGLVLQCEGVNDAGQCRAVPTVWANYKFTSGRTSFLRLTIQTAFEAILFLHALFIVRSQAKHKTMNEKMSYTVGTWFTLQCGAWVEPVESWSKTMASHRAWRLWRRAFCSTTHNCAFLSFRAWRVLSVDATAGATHFGGAFDGTRRCSIEVDDMYTSNYHSIWYFPYMLFDIMQFSVLTHSPYLDGNIVRAVKISVPWAGPAALL